MYPRCTRMDPHQLQLQSRLHGPITLQQTPCHRSQSILIRCRFISISASSTVMMSLLPDCCLPRPRRFSLRFRNTRSRCLLRPLPKFRMTTSDQKSASTVMAIESIAKIVKDWRQIKSTASARRSLSNLPTSVAYLENILKGALASINLDGLVNKIPSRPTQGRHEPGLDKTKSF
jgi:hypothetical protein